MKARKSLIGMMDIVSEGKHYAPWHIRVLNEKLLQCTARKIDRLIVTMPPRHGKQCSDNTFVYTSNGRKRHGDLQVGDYVFHPSGKPVRVTAVIPQTQPVTLRVTFTDRSYIDVHPHHEWTVYDRANGRWRTMETQQIASQHLFSGKRARFQLPLLQTALHYPERELPLDPYFLGAWLGDGKSKGASMCGSPDDLALILDQIPYPTSWQTQHKITGVDYVGWCGIQGLLKRLNVYGNKHIPELYLTAAEWQRRRLLSGLVDTDGHVAQDETQRVRFFNCNVRLVNDVVRLVRSLGYRATVSEQPPHSNGGIRSKRQTYTVQWTPHDGKGGGTLPRKRVNRIRQRRKVGIASISPCDPLPGKCITVDSPDGLYLVGETLVATHNSTTISHYFPTWYLGTHPDHRVMLASYEQELAASWGRKVRDTLTTWGDELFGIAISEKSSAADRWDIAGHSGGMVCVGVGGPLTGRGADVLIIDDYIKNSEEARSEVIREKHWDWWQGTAQTRLEPGGIAIILATRWHLDDLIGRVMDQDPDEWEVLSLPAIATHDEIYRQEGEALWPERYDIPALERIRRKSPFWFNAEYQCNPNSEEGDIFKRHGVRYYKEGNATDATGKVHHGYLLKQSNGEEIFVKSASCWRFISVDLAASEKEYADYTVYQCWAVTPSADMILLDQIHNRMPGPEKLPALKGMVERWEAHYVGVEKAGFQLDFLQNARWAGLPALEMKPKGDKLGRALEASAKWESGQIYLPANATWTQALIEEVCTFPNAPHDDRVDALSYAAIEVGKRGFSAQHAYGLHECVNCHKLYTVTERTGLDRPCPKCGTRPDKHDDELSAPVPLRTEATA
jgi:predicted phage terminase large subunit-like protein